MPESLKGDGNNLTPAINPFQNLDSAPTHRSNPLEPLPFRETVAAVIVTYNRKKLLVECLSGLGKQTASLDALILVDNASTDGTPDYLMERGIITAPLPHETDLPFESSGALPGSPGTKVTYRRLAENTGGAGGFHEGVKVGFQTGYDWLWLMDDDVEPLPDTLSKLLSFRTLSRCIHPSKLFEDGSRHNWEGYISPKTGRRVFLPDISFQKGLTHCETNTGCFEGMLVHREIVEKIGFPDRRFFIGSDDSIYGFLAHQHTRVLYTRDPIIIKKAGHPTGPISDRSIYYGMRNSFLREQYLNNHIRRYHFLRSVFMIVKFFDYASNILMSRKDKASAFRILIRATRDGFAGRYGKGI